MAVSPGTAREPDDLHIADLSTALLTTVHVSATGELLTRGADAVQIQCIHDARYVCRRSRTGPPASPITCGPSAQSPHVRPRRRPSGSARYACGPV